MARRKRGKGWRETPHGPQAWVTVHGQTEYHRFPKGTPIREVENWIAITKGERLTSTSPFAPKPTGRRGTFSADAKRYLDAVKAMPTYGERKRHIEEWIGVFVETRRNKITSADIQAHLHALKAKGLSASSVNHRRTALQHLYTVLDGKAAQNPVRDVPKFQEPSPQPRGVDYAIIRRILEKLPKGKHYARALVFAYTGIPPSLLKRIREADVDWNAGTVWVPERRKGKGVPARLVPLTEDGVKAFRAMQRYEAWGSFSRWRMGEMWKTAQEKAKVPMHVRVYDLRHSFGSALYKATGDLHATQELLGHSSPILTARYALAAVPARLQAAIAAMNPDNGSVGKDFGKDQGKNGRSRSISVEQQKRRKRA